MAANQKFLQVLVLVCLTLASVTATQAASTLTHIDGMDPGVYTSNRQDIGLSGDGQWAVWGTNDYDDFAVRNLDTGVETVLTLTVTTGDPDLQIPSDTSFDMNEDGSVIAFLADGPEGSRSEEIPLVLTREGLELARVVGTYFGDQAWFDDLMLIDSSGKFVVFGTDANYLQSEVGGVTASTLNRSGNLEDVYWMNVETGELRAVAIRPGGNELNDYSSVLGVSTGGRYVLFASEASNLPGATGEHMVYLRDMNSTAAGAIAMVSVDETGTPVTGLAWRATIPTMSDDGSRVFFSDENYKGYLWKRNTSPENLNEVSGSSTLITSIDSDVNLRLTANGRWLTAENEPFSRLNLDTGSIYALPTLPNNNPASFERVMASADGARILFESDLEPPEFQIGDWWMMEFPPLPDIDLPVSESVQIMDLTLVIPPVSISVFEAISVRDRPSAIPPIHISILESVILTDAIKSGIDGNSIDAIFIDGFESLY